MYTHPSDSHTCDLQLQSMASQLASMFTSIYTFPRQRLSVAHLSNTHDGFPCSMVILLSILVRVSVSGLTEPHCTDKRVGEAGEWEIRLHRMWHPPSLHTHCVPSHHLEILTVQLVQRAWRSIVAADFMAYSAIGSKEDCLTSLKATMAVEQLLSVFLSKKYADILQRNMA